MAVHLWDRRDGEGARQYLNRASDWGEFELQNRLSMRYAIYRSRKVLTQRRIQVGKETISSAA